MKDDKIGPGPFSIGLKTPPSVHVQYLNLKLDDLKISKNCLPEEAIVI